VSAAKLAGEAPAILKDTLAELERLLPEVFSEETEIPEAVPTDADGRFRAALIRVAELCVAGDLAAAEREVDVLLGENWPSAWMRRLGQLETVLSGGDAGEAARVAEALAAAGD